MAINKNNCALKNSATYLCRGNPQCRTIDVFSDISIATFLFPWLYIYIKKYDSGIESSRKLVVGGEKVGRENMCMLEREREREKVRGMVWELESSITTRVMLLYATQDCLSAECGVQDMQDTQLNCTNISVIFKLERAVWPVWDQYILVQCQLSCYCWDFRVSWEHPSCRSWGQTLERELFSRLNLYVVYYIEICYSNNNKCFLRTIYYFYDFNVLRDKTTYCSQVKMLIKIWTGLHPADGRPPIYLP